MHFSFGLLLAASSVLAAPVNTTSANVTSVAPLANASATAASRSPVFLPIPGPVNVTADTVYNETASEFNNKTSVLTSHKFDKNYQSEAYVANGFIGIRLPVQGQGFSQSGNASNYTALIEDRRFTGAYVSGFTAHSEGNGTLATEGFLASIPTWSELSVSVGNQSYNGSTSEKHISNYSQSLSLHNGVVSTNVTWSPTNDTQLQLNYTVLAHRARPNVGIVRLDITAQNATSVNITDLLDSKGSVGTSFLASGSDTGSIWTAVSALGSNSTVFEYSTLGFSNYSSVNISSEANSTQSISQTVPVELAPNTTFTVIKYVGIASSDASPATFATARKAALVARALGFDTLLYEHSNAWNNIWEDGNIIIPGDEELQIAVKASLFHLLSSVRSGDEPKGYNANGIAVGGLSSSNLQGLPAAVDSTVSPALLALYPQYAKNIVNYRVGLAKKVSSSSKTKRSLVEPYHTSIDSALNAWNYFVSTNNTEWLNSTGYEFIAAAANHYAQQFSLNQSVGAYTSNVTYKGATVLSSSYVNAGSVTLFKAASAASEIVGEEPNPTWSDISENIYIPQSSKNITLPSENLGNLTLGVNALTYPLVYDAESAAHSRALANFHHYSKQIEKKKLSPEDASLLAIDSAALSEAGSGSYTYLLQASQPFLRKPYYQFSAQEKPKGAFPYLPGAGSFLQIFTHGFTGFRPTQDTLFIDPALPPQLPEGYVVKGLKYQGEVYDINVTGTYTYITRRGIETLSTANATFGNGTFFANGTKFNATNTTLYDVTAFSNFTGLNVSTLPSFNWTALGANLTVSNFTVNNTRFGYFNFSSLQNVTFGDLNVTYWGGLNVSNVTLGNAHTLNVTNLGFANATSFNGTFFNHTSFGAHNVSTLPVFWELPSGLYNASNETLVAAQADDSESTPVFIQIGGRNSAAGNYSIKVNQTLIIPTYRGDLYFKNIPGNVAENAPVSSKDEWHPARFPVGINDGDNATYWQPINASRSEVVIDLGRERPVSEATIVWGPFTPKNYSIGVLPVANGTLAWANTTYSNFSVESHVLAHNSTIGGDVSKVQLHNTTARYVTLAIEGLSGKHGKHPGAVAELAFI
ncbi:Cell wall acid trehalase [Yarrowia sp. B02]|nr:Cell wall acid trehalase [Yarrowia sp. B02]